jgi:hypothetical protein
MAPRRDWSVQRIYLTRGRIVTQAIGVNFHHGLLDLDLDLDLDL